VALSNFSWTIPEKLAGSDLPGRRGSGNNELEMDLNFIALQGVKCLVSLELPDGPIGELCIKSGINWTYFPIPDFDVPNDVAQFELLILDIIASLENNKPVCVHCHAGVGRTGLVLSCVMGKYLSLSAKRAIEAVRKTRIAIDTVHQENFVKAFLSDYEN
jgi:atypical dual specificity phosphatase